MIHNSPPNSKNMEKNIGVGTTLQNRFILEQTIASGGMGVVYKARDLRKEEAQDREPYVAIKVLTENFKQHPDALISLQRESKKAQKLAHPNIVTVYDFDRDGDTVFMTMEYLEGQSLAKFNKTITPKGLPVEKVLSIINGIGEGLTYAHKQHIVHSDIKPGNIFITHDGIVKLLDFGIARAFKQAGSTSQDKTLFNFSENSGVITKSNDATIFDPSSLGALTPAYASCEMLEGLDPDPRDDIYAVACITYELLTGRHPFNKLSSTQARDQKFKPIQPVNFTREQWRGLLGGLAFNRNSRTPSVMQFIESIAPHSYRPQIIRGVVASAGLALLAIASFSYFNDSSLESTVAISIKKEIRPAILTPKEQERINTLIENAEVNLLVGRLIEPPESNASDSYKNILKLQPGNKEAQKGLEKISEQYLKQAQYFFNNGDITQANIHSQTGLHVLPNHQGLLALQKKLSDAQPLEKKETKNE